MRIEDVPPPFLGRHEGASELESALYALLPLPWERTVSWGGGTAQGPAGVLQASQYVELWDEELRREPWKAGIHTLPPPAIDDAALGHLEGEEALVEGLRRIGAAARPHMDSGRRVIGLGGEHGVTPALVREAAQVWPGLGVVQFDAHADLRATYEGSPNNHACAMHRVLDLGLDTLAVGIRSLSPPEAALAEEKGLSILWAAPESLTPHAFERALDRLPEQIYLTFDVDYFDPSVLPATGTPEPGGGSWHPTLAMLRTLFERKRVVAADVVELAPHPAHPASDFTVAKLVYKLIGYWGP